MHENTITQGVKMETRIYEVALRLAQEIGWRNVTRGPLLDACISSGLVGDCSPTSWAKNYLRGKCSMAALRERLSTEPGAFEGSPRGEKSGVWKASNRQAILDAAFRLAASKGRILITRSEIAREVGVSSGMVSLAWGGMGALRKAVVERAEREGMDKLVLQAQAIGLTA